MRLDAGWRNLTVFAPSDAVGSGDTALVADTPAAAPATTTEPAAAPAADAKPAEITAPLPTVLTTPKPAEPTEPAKPGDEPKPDDKPAEHVAPLKAEDYKIADGVLPEQIPTDDAIVQAFLRGAAEGGMDNDSVNAVIKELGPQLATKFNEPFVAWQTMNETWAAEVKADPDIGGVKLEASMLTLQQGMAAALPNPAHLAAAHKALEDTGAGNNLAIVRLLHSMGVRLTEKPAVQGDGPVAPPARSIAERMYPTHAKKTG